MATKRKAPSRARRTAPRARAAPSRARRTRRNPGASIPGAAATVGLIVGMATPIKTVISDMSVNGLKTAAQQAVQRDTLIKTGAFVLAGEVGGNIAKKYLPKVIREPVNKIARKIPKVL